MQQTAYGLVCSLGFTNLFKRLGFEAFQNVREVFLEALKLIQMKTSFKYDFYLKLSLVTDIGLNSDPVDHSPPFLSGL